MSVPDCVGVHDIMRVRATGEVRRVRALYRIDEEDFQSVVGLVHRRAMRPCFGDDEDLAVIQLFGSGHFYRPWELVLDEPLDPREAAFWVDRNDFERSIGDTTQMAPFTDSSYPEIFAPFGPLTAHDRIRLARWQHETGARLQAFETTS